MKKRITFVGLDTHKNSIEAALADDGRNTEVRLYGTIGGDLASLDKMIRKLQTTGAELRFVYEAGPCGYEIYRHLRAHGLLDELDQNQRIIKAEIARELGNFDDCLLLLSYQFDRGYDHAIGFIKKLAEEKVRAVKPFEAGK